MIKSFFKAALVMALFTGCLRTRAELGESDQSNVYGSKAADNQIEAQTATAKPVSNPDTVVATAPADEKDELIRSLNGRVEVLENQMQALAKDREDEKKQYEETLTVLQQAITKLASDNAPEEAKPADKDAILQSSDAQAANAKTGKTEAGKTANKKSDKKVNPLDAGEEYFTKQDWKKAILSFHQYTDETPKGKHVPDAKYKIGICFQQLGMKEEARAYFEEVVANYGTTDAGKKSKSRLAKLKK